MVHPTAHQLAIDVLLEAFVTHHLIESNNSLDSLITHLIDSDSGSDSNTDLDGETYAWDETLPPLSKTFLQGLLALHASHYINPHISIPKTGHLLWILLNVYRIGHESIFRTYMHISPQTFDSIINKISGAGIFHNNSQNPQLPVEHQLTITLFQLGHYGNATSMQKVALWAGIGVGTVDLCTWRVMMVLCVGHFQYTCMRWLDHKR